MGINVKKIIRDHLPELISNNADQALWIVLTATGKENKKSTAQKVQALETILKNGAFVDAMLPHRSITPLLYAVTTRQTECAKLFMDHGANVQYRTPTDITPLSVAVRLNENETVQELLNHKAVPDIDLIITALHTKNIKAVRLLIQAGMDINALWNKKITPLGIAVIRESHKEVEYLLSLGANPNKPNANGLTPLGAALSGNHFESFQTLIESGADVNQPIMGKPLLFYAADAGKTAFVKALIQAGADIKYTDANGHAALHYAATPEIRQLLLNARTDKNAQTKNGQANLKPIQRASLPHRFKQAIKTIVNNRQRS